MSLKQQTFKVNNIEKKDYDDVHFIPAIVDGKEVYEVKNSSNIHCGYVTEAFLEALIKVSDEDGKLNQNFAVNNTQEWTGDVTLLSRKIILDAPKDPSKILIQGVVLRPTIYPEEMENKALTIATNGCFRIMSPFCPLDIKVNHDFIEAESFSIVRVGGTADKSVTIDLDLATNRVGDLNIDGFYGESAFGGPYLKLKCTNEEVAPDITILGYTIDGNTNDKSEAGYIHFETAGEFAAREGRVYIPKSYGLNGKEPSRIVSKKDGIFLMNSNITLKSDDDLSPVSLVTNGKILLKETDAVLTGKSDIDGIFRCDPTAKQTRKSSVWMRDFASESGIYLKSKNSSECIFRLGNSYLSNGEKDIVMKGEVSLVGVRLNNEIKSKELTLENVNIRYAILNDISDLKNAKIANSEVENCEIINEEFERNGLVRAGVIFIGPIKSDYDERNIEYEDEKQSPIIKMRDSKIELGRDDVFDMRSDAEVNASNISSNGSFNLFVPEGAKITMKNSLFNNAEMSFIGTSKVNIADAEVSGKLEALSLSNIEGSVLSNVSLCDITSVENSFLEDFSTANTPFSRIRDYNSNSKEEPKNDLGSPMTTTDFEAL